MWGWRLPAASCQVAQHLQEVGEGRGGEGSDGLIDGSSQQKHLRSADQPNTPGLWSGAQAGGRSLEGVEQRGGGAARLPPPPPLTRLCCSCLM